MIVVLDTTLKLEAVLAGAVATNQPEVHVGYIDYYNDGQITSPQPFRAALNNTTDVTILAAPANGPQFREPTMISVYNKDTASVTVTIKTDDGTTERIIMKKVLATLETLWLQKDSGVYVTNA